MTFDSPQSSVLSWKRNPLVIRHRYEQELPSKTRYERKVEERLEVTERRGRRRKKLQDVLKEKQGY
jgi:hypothetical protein